MNKQQLNVQHMVYDFPIDRDIRINVQASSYKKLFSQNHKILLPVFQRRYCWNSGTNQLQAWWTDVSTAIYNKHQIGKIIFFETSDGLLCVDGQQRTATTLIILCSIRDVLDKFDQNDKNVINLKQEINNIFFNDINAATNFKDEIKEGDRLKFINFTPTYYDRKTYYHLVLQRPVEQAGYLLKSKLFFDEKFSTLNLSRVLFIYQQLMNDFAFVTVGLPESELRKGFHIYQWFFEKSLYTEKIFYIKSPGIKHTVQELVKNFLLSFFIDETYEKQNEVYETLWLTIEMNYSVEEFHQYVVNLTNSKNIESYDIYREYVEMIEKDLLKEENYMEYIQNYMKELIKNKV